MLPEEPAVPDEEIRLLEFSRNPDEFRLALLEGDDLKACRDAMAAHDPPQATTLPSGTKVFVHPHQYDRVLQAVKDQGITLNLRHVIVASDLKHLVDRSLAHIPRAKGARVKNGGDQRLELDPQTADPQTEET